MCIIFWRPSGCWNLFLNVLSVWHGEKWHWAVLSVFGSGAAPQTPVRGAHFSPGCRGNAFPLCPLLHHPWWRPRDTGSSWCQQIAQRGCRRAISGTGHSLNPAAATLGLYSDSSLNSSEKWQSSLCRQPESWWPKAESLSLNLIDAWFRKLEPGFA